MRPVDRGAPPELLISLVTAQPDRKWDSGGEPDVHRAIKGSLRSAQAELCAYCEQPLLGGGQVEHIHPRTVDPCATRSNHHWHYDWTNLLLVCGSASHCDGPKANEDWCAEVLFPDEMSPEMSYFTVNSLDGEISVKDGLPESVWKQAKRAVDALVLNHPNLKRSRLNVIEQLQADLSSSDQEHFALHRARCSGFPSTIEAYLA